MISVAIGASAAVLPYHCQQDTARLAAILNTLRQSGSTSTGDRIALAATELEGASEDQYYRKDSIATLRVNLEEFTPLMLVNSVIALARTSRQPSAADSHTFSNELENIACRRGDNKGFPSIMFHASDWIADNISRGNLIELTEDYSGAVAHTKSLDEMTRNRKNYAALADSATFEAVRMTELGFRNHRVPALKKETIKKKELAADLRNGDILILTPNKDGVDIYDIGVVKIENDIPYFVHLSPQTGTVVKEKDDLARYMGLKSKYFQGFRILRLKD